MTLSNTLFYKKLEIGDTLPNNDKWTCILVTEIEPLPRNSYSSRVRISRNPYIRLLIRIRASLLRGNTARQTDRPTARREDYDSW